LQINTKIVGFLSAHGISALQDVAIGCSFLPSEVATALAQLAKYRLVELYGVSSSDSDTISKQMFDKAAKVRLSTKGHLQAPEYQTRTSE
jgi:hypothetical protein